MATTCREQATEGNLVANLIEDLRKIESASTSRTGTKNSNCIELMTPTNHFYYKSYLILLQDFYKIF